MTTTTATTEAPREKPEFGEVFEAATLFLRVAVGSANKGKREYELSTGLNSAPVVRSAATGKWFCLSWEDVLRLADAAGIDEDTPKRPGDNGRRVGRKTKVTPPPS